MVKKRRGITLIELLLYLLCSLLVSSCAVRLLDQFRNALIRVKTSSETMIELALAMNCLIDDFSKVCRKKAVIKELSTQHSILTEGSREVRWLVKKRRLLRTTGSYKGEKGLWKKGATTVFLHELEAFECIPLPDALNPELIRCTISKKSTTKSYSLTASVGLR